MKVNLGVKMAEKKQKTKFNPKNIDNLSFR
jgi:hypothetical protein